MWNWGTCMQRRKPGSWDTLIMPEGSPFGHVRIKHICIPGKGQPVHLDHITPSSPPTHHGRRNFLTNKMLPKGTMFVLAAMHIMNLKRAANQVKTKESFHLSNCTEWWMSHTVWKKERKNERNKEWKKERKKKRKKEKEKESCVMLIPFTLQIPNYLQPFVVCLCVFVWVGLEEEQSNAQR